MVLKDIPRVLYSPQKAFKSITQKPSYIGPLVILIIFTIVFASVAYVTAQRWYIDQSAPDSTQGDIWTENASYWTSSGTISNNTSTYISSGTTYYNYFGNTSIQFSNSSTNDIWMQTSGNFDLNCTSVGYRDVSLRVIIVSPDVAPQNVTLTLLSGNSSFNYDLTSIFSNGTTNVWYNLTVPLDTTGWASSGTPNWEHITGLKMEFMWENSSSVNVIFDGLYFKGQYTSYADSLGISFFLQYGLNAVVQFVFEWIILTGLMFLLLKGLKINSVWKPLFISVGYALVVLVIQYIVLGVVFAFIYPSIYYPLEYLAQLPTESQNILTAINNQMATVTQVNLAIQIVFWAWIVALGTFLIRANSTIVPPPSTALPYQPSETPPSTTPQAPQPTVELSWGKCVAVSAGALLFTILILSLLTSFGIL